jgi:small nuclear ribonucleoprotein (snRNP)-like protein
VESDQVSNVLNGVKLMKESKFKEAREWFSEHKLMAKAADCTILIKAKRQIRAYKAELKSVENSHNLQLAKSHLDDMVGWRAICVSYGLDTTEIDEIINSYKSIK